MFNKKISVLMVNYNHEAHLPLTIESVLSQSYPEYSIYHY